MKKLLGYSVAVMLLLSAALPAQGQSLGKFRDKLMMPDAHNNARITISEKGDAAQQISSLSANRIQGDTLRGFRVTVFSGNSQNARSGAEAARRRFREAFPGIPVYWSYRAPDFKVSVGDCLTREEAIILQGRVKSLFPTAFLTSEKIPLRAFTVVEDISD